MIKPESLNELKHSIRMHMIINGGTSQQLCMFLLKLIDFVAEQSDHSAEAVRLSYNISEATAINIMQHVEHTVNKSNGKLPESIIRSANEILITIGNSRLVEDKIASKYSVLRAAAETLRTLSTYTKSPYPKLTDLHGVEL